MDEKTLRDRLARLHGELADAQQQNPATRQSLGKVLPDLKRVVDSGDAGADKTLPDRLERFAVEFEAQHPGLAATARQLIELLGEAGI